jgi:hypothetical protein
MARDAAQIEYRDPKTPGLSLIVGRRAKTWSLTYATTTGRRRTTLGRYPTVSLADARRSAETKRVAARDGVDHQQAKRDYNAARTVSAVAQDYLDKEVRLHSASRSYAWVIRNDVIPTIGDMKIVDVRRRDIIRVVDGALGKASSTWPTGSSGRSRVCSSLRSREARLRKTPPLVFVHRRRRRGTGRWTTKN